MEIARLYSKGTPFVKAMPEWKERFKTLYEEIEGRVGSAQKRKGAVD
jgi:hypothetical protein